MDEQRAAAHGEDLRSTRLKRRGVLAAAWAAVAALVMKRTERPVEAAAANLQYAINDIGQPIFNTPSTAVQINNAQSFGIIGGANVLKVTASTANQLVLDAINGSAFSGGNGIVGIASSGNGVLGLIPQAPGANAIAVYGQNYSTYAGPSPGAGGFGVYGLSAKGHGLVGATATAGGAAVVGATNGVAGAFAAAFYGPVIIGGDFTVVGGAKSAAIPYPDGKHRRLYCVESPESWFEDFGRGQLECGRAQVTIDPDFGMVADLTDYHVFLTECGGHNDLSVAEQTAIGFRVEAKDPASATRFSWRVVARRKDINGKRFAEVTVPPEPQLPPPVDMDRYNAHRSTPVEPASDRERKFGAPGGI